MRKPGPQCLKRDSVPASAARFPGATLQHVHLVMGPILIISLSSSRVSCLSTRAIAVSPLIGQPARRSNNCSPKEFGACGSASCFWKTDDPGDKEAWESITTRTFRANAFTAHKKELQAERRNGAMTGAKRGTRLTSSRLGVAKHTISALRLAR